jgi:ABC-type multidrug transport system ATPase subunit
VLTVGRDRSAGIGLFGDNTVSSQAAVLRRDSRGSAIRAVNSEVLINGASVAEGELVFGDLIRIGVFAFQFRGTHLRLSNGAGAALSADGLIRDVWDRQRPGHKLRILDNAFIRVPGNSFVGLLGPSGHGKTTLLKALSGLESPNSGRVLIDGRDFLSNPAEFSSLIGYVPQDDIVHEQLSVEQALMFSARLRLPAELPIEEIQKLVARVVERVDLRPHISKRIREASGGGLSGGQRKRVSVAVELLGCPRLLFLDEPTSGLDPATETRLMEFFRSGLANQGCTVVCTTHVVENAALMDQLVVIVHGQVRFAGTVHEAVDTFGVDKLNQMYVVLSDEAERIKAESKGRPAGDSVNRSLAEWLEWWRLRVETWPRVLSSQWREAIRLGRMMKEIRRGQIGHSLVRAATRLKSPAAVLQVLLERHWAILNSDWKNLALLGVQPLVIGLAVGMFVDNHETKGFLAHLTTLWLGCNNAAQEIVKEVAIFRRERFVGLSPWVYLTSKFVFGSLLTLAQAALLFACLDSFGSGWDGKTHLQILCLALTALAANSIGLAISAWSRSIEQALFMVPLVLIPQILFSGFVVPLSEWRQGGGQPPADHDSAVLHVVRWMPGYASQRLIDTAHLWECSRTTPFRNDLAFLNLHADGLAVYGTEFERWKPVWTGALKLLLFVLIGLRLASWPLRAPRS